MKLILSFLDSNLRLVSLLCAICWLTPCFAQIHTINEVNPNEQKPWSKIVFSTARYYYETDRFEVGLRIEQATISDLVYASQIFEGKNLDFIRKKYGTPAKETPTELYYRFFLRDAIPSADRDLFLVFVFSSDSLFQGLDFDFIDREY